jgi:hypothetical protein
VRGHHTARLSVVLPRANPIGVKARAVGWRTVTLRPSLVYANVCKKSRWTKARRSFARDAGMLSARRRQEPAQSASMGVQRVFPTLMKSIGLNRRASKGTLSKFGGIRLLTKIFSGSARTTANRLCVYTAVFAGYDSIIEHVAQTVDCDFVVFTDDGADVPTGQFRVAIKDNPGGQTSPLLKNCWLRLFPFEIPELNDYEILIYMDPNARICDPSFLEKILRRCEETSDFDLMLSAHPWNVCIYQEARDSRQIAKYGNTDLEGQVETYRRAGFPADGGLYWNGFIVYNRACDQCRVRKFQKEYWKELIAYNKTPDAHPQGQVSLPYCLWKSGLKLVTIPQLYRSPLLEIRPHLR